MKKLCFLLFLVAELTSTIQPVYTAGFRFSSAVTPAALNANILPARIIDSSAHSKNLDPGFVCRGAIPAYYDKLCRSYPATVVAAARSKGINMPLPEDRREALQLATLDGCYELAWYLLVCERYYFRKDGKDGDSDESAWTETVQADTEFRGKFMIENAIEWGHIVIIKLLLFKGAFKNDAIAKTVLTRVLPLGLSEPILETLKPYINERNCPDFLKAKWQADRDRRESNFTTEYQKRVDEARTARERGTMVDL